ncbi:MAG: DUF5647 family protein [bacterium]
MTEKKFFEKSLTLSAEFSKYVLAHPKVGEQIPDDALVVFLLADDPKFNERSVTVARANREKNQPIIFVKAEGLAQPLESRLINPHLELSSAI